MKKLLIIALTTLALVLPLGSGTAEAAKPKKWKVTAEVSSSKIISGQTVYVTGKLPKAIGRKVILQKRYKKNKGKWRKVDVAFVGADAKFKLSDTPRTARKRFYRVVKKAGDGFRTGASAPMKVKVEPWDGRVDVKLMWDSGANLDLFLSGPDGTISQAQPGPTASGGTFNPESTPACGLPGAIEAISWPNHDAPAGYYSVSVGMPTPVGCDGDTSPEWRLEVSVNGKVVRTANGSGPQEYVLDFGGTGW